MNGSLNRVHESDGRLPRELHQPNSVSASPRKGKDPGARSEWEATWWANESQIVEKVRSEDPATALLCDQGIALIRRGFELIDTGIEHKPWEAVTGLAMVQIYDA